MVFNAGVTAIVGPNGCGKSNVSDAVRWVLGEQRARLLRGAKMEEVIFQGSSARRAVNVAEVSLHFSNEDGTLPVAFQEVVITRRLSRSGESEYFLNRAPCRLRDISDLLRGTGLGADTGVVIESKMIDALLSDRPDDRRELFEEAAGVGLYRDRRRTTERRLEETTVDLQRLDDLITEVQSQVRSLARQRQPRRATLGAHGATLHDRDRAREARDGSVARRAAATRRTRARRCARALRRPKRRSARPSRRATRRTAIAPPPRRSAPSCFVSCRRSASRCSRSAARWRSPKSVSATRSARRQRAELEANEGEAYGDASRPIANRRATRASACDRRKLRRGARDARRSVSSDEDETRQTVARSARALDDAERAHRELQDRSRRVDIDRERARRRATSWCSASSSWPRSARSSPTR